jgi:hypothetical protein
MSSGSAREEARVVDTSIDVVIAHRTHAMTHSAIARIANRAPTHATPSPSRR